MFQELLGEAADAAGMCLPAPILRQALLYLVSVAARYAPSGELLLRVEATPQALMMSVEASPGPAGPATKEAMSADEELRLATVRLAFGSLACELPEGACGCLRYTLTLPTAEQIPVLVVDDNADALQLFGRYLAGSRFRSLGAANANTALTLAREMAPHAIVLDVMMPDDDGWTLLRRLRANPWIRLHPDRRVLDSGPASTRRSARRVRLAAQADHTRRDAGGSGSPARPGSARRWVTNSIPSTTVWMVSPPACVKAKALLVMGWPCGSRAEITSTGISSRLGRAPDAQGTGIHPAQA